MGNNFAYTTWEAWVVATYNRNALSRDLLDEVGEVYRGVDVDHGGSRDLLTHDGKTADRVVLETVLTGFVTQNDYTDDEVFDDLCRGRWGWR